MKPRFATFAIALLLGGCAAFSLLPPEAKAISRAAVSSARVDVGKPRLTISGGVAAIEGLVRRNLGRQSTAGSYLEVTLLNVAGEILKRERADFTPTELLFPLGRHERYGSYRLILGALPPGTARIEVRAHDTDPPASG